MKPPVTTPKKVFRAPGIDRGFIQPKPPGIFRASEPKLANGNYPTTQTNVYKRP